MSNELDIRRRRAGFRANHRGTKEMDWMLGRYADQALATMQDPELADFEHLLTVADQEIQGWLLAPQSCSQARCAGLVDAIRRFHNLGDEPRPD